MRLLAGFLGSIVCLQAHDIVTTAMTFDRQVSRIVFERCAPCHREGGTAFPMLTYAQTRPWAVAIKEEILRRRMPPWGAVKGFGEFRNDQGLSSEEIEVLVSWIDGGVPEGNEKDLPQLPKFASPGKTPAPKGAIAIGADYKLVHPMKLDGLLPKSVPLHTSIKLTAELPDGSVQPLLWLDGYQPEFGHPFLFRQALSLPAGTMIRGLSLGALIMLLPGK